MKRLFGILAVLMLCAAPLLAQNDSMVLVPKSSLTREQVNQVQLQTASRWIGMGKEIGEAVNSSLTALTTTASNFADTKLGHFTMYLIAFKVIGYPIIQAAVGLPLLFVFTIIFIWSYWKTCVPRRYVIKASRDEKGKMMATDWKIANDDSDLDARRAVHFFLYIVAIGVALLVIFIH